MSSRSLAAILALLSMGCGAAQTAVSDKPETRFQLATFEGRVGLVIGLRVAECCHHGTGHAAQPKSRWADARTSTLGETVRYLGSCRRFCDQGHIAFTSIRTSQMNRPMSMLIAMINRRNSG